MVGDVADSVYPALYIVIFYGNADFFLVDVDFEVGVARADDGDAEGKCFYESGQSYGVGESRQQMTMQLLRATSFPSS